MVDWVQALQNLPTYLATAVSVLILVLGVLKMRIRAKQACCLLFEIERMANYKSGLGNDKEIQLIVELANLLCSKYKDECMRKTLSQKKEEIMKKAKKK